MKLPAFGAFLVALALVVGALAAHVLPESTPLNLRLGVFNAVSIQLAHGVLFFCIGQSPAQRVTSIASYPLVAGTLLFCGSVYLKAFGYLEHASLAPFGGGLLIVTWLMLSIALALKIAWKPRA